MILLVLLWFNSWTPPLKHHIQQYFGKIDTLWFLCLCLFVWLLVYWSRPTCGDFNNLSNRQMISAVSLWTFQYLIFESFVHIWRKYSKLLWGGMEGGWGRKEILKYCRQGPRDPAHLSSAEVQLRQSRKTERWEIYAFLLTSFFIFLSSSFFSFLSSFSKLHSLL